MILLSLLSVALLLFAPSLQLQQEPGCRGPNLKEVGKLFAEVQREMARESDARIGLMHDEIISMRTDILKVHDELKAVKDSSNEKIEGLENRVGSLAKEAMDTKKEQNRTLGALRDTNSKLKATRTTLIAANTEISLLKAAQKDLATKNKALSLELASLNQQSQAMKARLAAVENAQAGLIKEVSVIKGGVSGVKTEVSTVKDEVAVTVKEVSAIKAQVTANKDGVSRLTSTQDSMSTGVELVQTRQNRIKMDISLAGITRQIGWHLVFRHNSRNNNKYFSSVDQVVNGVGKPSNDLYSALHTLDGRFKDASGKFEFRIVWPDLKAGTGNYNQWRQTSNPANSASVTGYEPVTINWNRNGVGKSNAFAGLGLNMPNLRGSCAIDDLPDDDNWCFCIGALAAWQKTGFFPGPCYHNSLKSIQDSIGEVMLFVKVPGPMPERT